MDWTNSGKRLQDKMLLVASKETLSSMSMLVLVYHYGVSYRKVCLLVLIIDAKILLKYGSIRRNHNIAFLYFFVGGVVFPYFSAAS